MATGDNNRFLREWFEVNYNKIAFRCHNADEFIKTDKMYVPYNKSGDYRKWYGNFSTIVNWSDDGYNIKHFTDGKGKLRSRPQNVDYYFKRGITWSLISTNTFAARLSPGGFIFDVGGSSGFASEDKIMYGLGLLCSRVAYNFLGAFNPTINFQIGDIKNVPMIYDTSRVLEVNSYVKKCVEISKGEWDSYEVSWDFKKNPMVELGQSNHFIKLNDTMNFYQNALANEFEKLKKHEECINQLFLEIYNLENQYTPEVADKTVSIRRITEREAVLNMISYAVGCMFGRYSLDKDGLVFAGGDFEDVFRKKDVLLSDDDGSILIDSDGVALATGEEYYGKIKQEDGSWTDTTFYPDMDNCIPITDEEYFSDDIVGRFVEFVKIVYGADTLEENLDFIAKALGNKGNTSREVIRNYFLKDFYTDHLKVYQKRPIYWLFDSGKENGFKALIYMHRYNP